MDRADSGGDEQEALLSFVYLCPVGILQIDTTGAVQMLNPMAAQLLMPLVRHHSISNLFEALERCAPELRHLVASFSQPRGRICSNHRLFAGERKGASKVLSCTMLKLEAQCIMVMLDDVSEQVAQERRLQQADCWMTAIFSSVNDFACFTLDETGLIDSWNLSGVRQTGFDENHVLGQTLQVLRLAGEPSRANPRDELEYLDGARREGWYLQETRCATRDGREFWCQILVTALKEQDGEIAGFSVVLRDVTERRMTSDELRRLLTTDHLTGAANRSRLFEAGTAEVARWKRDARPLSVIMMDADHFKRINDTFGHAAGDVVLRALVSRCQSILRSIDVLARFGGEEFVIMLPGTDSCGAVELAERMRKAIADSPMVLNGEPASITVSLGCASMGDEVTTLESLLKAADIALYRAKQLGRNRTCLHENPGMQGDQPTSAPDPAGPFHTRSRIAAT